MITRLRVTYPAGEPALLLAPNCALSHEQLRLLPYGLGASALVVAGLAAWCDGNLFAPVFALLELPLLMAAFAHVWRASERREQITVRDGQLRVEQIPACGRTATEFPVAWTRVRAARRNDGHVHVLLAASGREQEVGSCLGDDERLQLFRGLKAILSSRSGWGAG